MNGDELILPCISYRDTRMQAASEEVHTIFPFAKLYEKTTQIYMLTLGEVVNVITDEGIAELANLWNLKMLDGVLKL